VGNGFGLLNAESVHTRQVDNPDALAELLAERVPLLVLGLDRGGACRGIAFRVAEKIAPRRWLTCASANKSPRSIAK